MKVWILRIKAVVLAPLLIIIMFLYCCLVVYFLIIGKRLKLIPLGLHENTTGSTSQI